MLVLCAKLRDCDCIIYRASRDHNLCVKVCVTYPDPPTYSFLVVFVRNAARVFTEPRNNFWIFLCSQLEEALVVFPVRQAIHVARFAEEASARRVRQGSHFRVSDLRAKIQAQTPLAIARQADSLYQYMTVRRCRVT